MDLKDLVLKNRTYRRFDESIRIDLPVLESFIELARLTPSTGNRQPLKFLIYNTRAECENIFPFLAWAGYLKDWPGPDEGERPSAYIIILGDRLITESFGVDHGIVAQTIMLGATEKGLGGCIIQSVKRDDLREKIRLPDRFEILLVLALGKPVEKVVLDEIKDDNVKYWRDADRVHHVPKRTLRDIILEL